MSRSEELDPRSWGEGAGHFEPLIAKMRVN